MVVKPNVTARILLSIGSEASQRHLLQVEIGSIPCFGLSGSNLRIPGILHIAQIYLFPATSGAPPYRLGQRDRGWLSLFPVP